MAALTSDQFHLVYQDGACGRTALYALKNVSAADTFDVAGHFKVVKRGGIVSETGTHIAAVTIAGTILTIPTGPLADAVWALIVGVAA